MRKTRFCAVLLVGALLVPLTAAKAQMAVGDPPAVSGPMSLGRAKCSTETVIDVASEKEAARVRLCSWLIRFSPFAENDGDRNYGFTWAQSTVRPLNGFCALRVSTRIRLPHREGRVHKRTPRRSLTITAPITKTVRLRTTAAGHSSRVGSASQSFTLYPRNLETSYFRNDWGRVYDTTWRGKTPRKVAFATGLAISWRAGLGAPTFVPSVGYKFVDPQHCPGTA